MRTVLLASLRTAVDRRMVADVPVGVLLSGGIDSSLVVALLAEAGQHDLKTFSIGFESAGGEAGDEFEYSDEVARHFGTDHHRIRIPSSRLLDGIDGSIQAMSEPMVSHDCVAFYLLSQEVSQHVKVVQSGQGADEVLGGYSWYPPLAATPRDQAAEVVGVVPQRLGNAFAHRLVAGEMHHRVDGEALDRVLHRRGVLHRCVDHFHTAAGDFCQPIEHRRMAVGEVVEQHRPQPGVVQRHRGVAADVAGAAGEQDGCHGG